MDGVLDQLDEHDADSDHCKVGQMSDSRGRDGIKTKSESQR